MVTAEQTQLRATTQSGRMHRRSSAAGPFATGS